MSETIQIPALVPDFLYAAHNERWDSWKRVARSPTSIRLTHDDRDGCFEIRWAESERPPFHSDVMFVTATLVEESQ